MHAPKHPTHPGMPARLIGLSYKPVTSRYDTPTLHLIWEFPHDGLHVHTTYDATCATHSATNDPQAVALRALIAVWTVMSPIVESTREDLKGLTVLRQTSGALRDLRDA